MCPFYVRLPTYTPLFKAHSTRNLFYFHFVWFFHFSFSAYVCINMRKSIYFLLYILAYVFIYVHICATHIHAIIIALLLVGYILTHMYCICALWPPLRIRNILLIQWFPNIVYLQLYFMTPKSTNAFYVRLLCRCAFLYILYFYILFNIIDRHFHLFAFNVNIIKCLLRFVVGYNFC